MLLASRQQSAADATAAIGFDHEELADIAAETIFSFDEKVHFEDARDGPADGVSIDLGDQVESLVFFDLSKKRGEMFVGDARIEAAIGLERGFIGLAGVDEG